MSRYVLRRLLLSVPVFILATVIVFALVSFRGDPLAHLRQQPGVAPETIAALEREFHLNDSGIQRYWDWLSDFVRGDWGTSYATRRPVAEMIGAALPNTLILVGGAVIISVTLAMAVGVVGAVRHRSAVDHALSGLSYVGLSMPTFWLGLLLQLLLVIVPYNAYGIRLVYATGMHSTGNEGQLVDLLRHLVLPVLTLSMLHVAAWSRFQRAGMLDALSTDYVRTARAKGVPEGIVIFRHALRNALLPFVTVTALGLAAMVGGSIVTERVFAWPGMGTLFVAALSGDDHPVILACLGVSAVAMILANLAADLAYGALSPRTAER